MDGDRSRTAKEIVDYRGEHLRVLGPPGSGKTSLLIERFRRLTAPSGTTSNVAVVTYTRRHRALLVDRLLKADSARFGKTPVFTYHELAQTILTRGAPTDWRLIDTMEQRVILARVLRRAEKTKRLISDYASVADSEAFQRSILQVFQNLQQYGFSSGDLDQLAKKAGGDRARDIFVLAREYFSLLESHRLMTHFDAAWRAARIVETNPEANPLGGVSVLLIDDFQDVDAGQYELISAVAPAAGPVEVNVFGDPCGAHARDRGATDRYLCDVFPDDYRPRDFVLPSAHSGSTALETAVRILLDETVPRHLRGDFETGGPQAVAVGEAIDASLDVAEDEVAEAQHVANRAAELIRSGKYRPEEIAVAARDKSKYESVLSRVFAERGLVLDSGRRERSALEVFVRSLLDLLRNSDENARVRSRAANLAAVADSPFFLELKKKLQAPKTGDDSAGEDRNETAWLTDEIVRCSIALAGNGNGAAGGGGLPLFFQTFIRPLLETLDPSDVPEAFLWFLGAMTDEWTRYCDLAASLKVKPALSEFLAASPTLGDRASRLPAFSSRVGFYSCHELASYRFPAVFVVGCSEFLFPAPPQREGYIPYESLQDCIERVLPHGAAVEFSRARSPEAHLRDECALMLNTFSCASRGVYLSSPRSHDGQYCPAPAFVLAGMPRNNNGADVTRTPAAYLRLAKAVSDSCPASRKGDKTKSSSGDTDRLAVRDRPLAADHGVSALWMRPRPPSRQLKIEERRLSASSLQTYTVCERKFFYDKVLRVEVEETIHLTFGRLFHTLVQRICDEHKTYEALRSVVDSDRIEGYITGVMEDAGELAADVLVARAARHHLHEMMRGLCGLEADRGDGYLIEATEKPIKFNYRNRGFIAVLDRRDKSRAAGAVTLDYKTGSSAVPKTGKTVRERILPACKHPDKRLWQVPLYCRAAKLPDGGYPDAFFYYVLEPDKEPFAAGVYVGEKNTPLGPEAIFREAPRKRFGHLTPQELENCLDEAISVADEMFAMRLGFARTEDRQHCRNCSYKTVCGRDS